MSRISDRLVGLNKIKEIDKNKDDYLVIHYSSESFLVLKGKSPRITSIAIQNLENGQAELFAIYKSAETLGYEFENITENYAEIENSMLEDYFSYLKTCQHKKWLHWNMRDSIFGFKALEHRYEVLKGIPFKINDNSQINITDLFKKLYGNSYIDDPKMVSLMNKNNLKPRFFLDGKEEAAAFNNGDYYSLSLSTSAKVRMFAQFINLAIDKKLLTNIPKNKLYGDSIKAIWFNLKEKPIFIPLAFIITNVISALIGFLVTNLLE